jgi:hypothetical protein
MTSLSFFLLFRSEAMAALSLHSLSGLHAI